MSIRALIICQLSLWLLAGTPSCHAFAPKHFNNGVENMASTHPSSLLLPTQIPDKRFGNENGVVKKSRYSSLSLASSSSSDEEDLVVIPSDYRLGIEFLLVGTLLGQIPYVKWVLGLPIALLGVLFCVQASRIRFVFSKESFELRMGGDELNNSGENIVVGGDNVWTYDSFVNWEFFPKGWIDQPQGPILAYFKETQTPSDQWNTGPGKFANEEEKIRIGISVPGQVHFFPAICNTKMLRDEFQKRDCAKL